MAVVTQSLFGCIEQTLQNRSLLQIFSVFQDAFMYQVVWEIILRIGICQCYRYYKLRISVIIQLEM